MAPLKAVLFVLIGFEVLLIAFTGPLLVAGAAAIAVTLLARWLTVGVPVSALSGFFRLMVLALTYCVVVFSILAQD